jgi:L-methionine (R)-S-oxide reductase
VATGTDQNVGDVRALQNYIACNSFTRSELVVLIRRGAAILGQIDVDSDLPNPFTPAEEAAVRRVAEGLAVLL